MAPSQILAGVQSLASRTAPSEADAPSRIVARQAPATVTVIVTETVYRNTLSDGAIAGIVIGSVIGALLIIWLIWWAISRRSVPDEKPAYYHQEVVAAPRHHHRRHHHHHHSHSRGRGSRSRSRSGDLRVVTSQTTAYPAEPVRTYYQEKRTTRRRSRSQY